MLGRRRAGVVSPSRLLAGWGVTLAGGEEMRLLAFGHVNAGHGYLVITDRRRRRRLFIRGPTTRS